MARAGRLAPYGATGRFFGVAVSAVGSIVAATSVVGDASGGAIGTIDVTASVTAVGASIAAASGFILARGITDGGVSATIIARAGTITAVVAVGGSSVTFRSRLGLYGASQHFYATPNKLAVTNRIWAANETLGLALNIADTDQRFFNLVDSLGLRLASTAFFGSSRGICAVAVSVSGTSRVIANAIGSIAITVTPAGAGANVVTLSGDGSSTSLVTVAGQGSTAGNVFSLGVGSVQSLTAPAAVAISTYEARGTIASVTTLAAIGAPIREAVGSCASVVTCLGLSTDYAAGFGNCASITTPAAVGASTVAQAGAIASVVTVIGISPVTTLSQSAGIQIDVAAPSMRVEMASSTIRIEIAA